MKKYLAIIILCITVLFNIKAQGYKAYTHCAEQDSLALVAFYNATDGPHWTSSSDTFNIANIGSDGDYGAGYFTAYPYAGKGKWLSGPVKDWFGVLLEKQPIGTSTDSVWRVIHITPTLGRRANGNDNLKGYIPKEVGLLTALQWFRINGNNGLSPTELPNEIYHPTLTQIDIENALMGGVISDGIKNCKILNTINLRYNYWDSIPTLDFMSKDLLLKNFGSTGSNIFLYSTHISYATIEKSVDYFKSFTDPTPTIKYQVQNLSYVGRAQEIVAKPGDNVTLTCYEAGTQGTCTWEKKGVNSYKTGTTYTINAIAAKDTGVYRGMLENAYIKNWQIEGNTGVSTVYTKPIHVVFTPIPPTCSLFSTSYSGNEIHITFSKAMAIPSSLQASQFTVFQNGKAVAVKQISRTGRLFDTYILTLESSVNYNDAVTVSYTAGSVVDANGGVLNSFTSKNVQNLTRKAPQVINAKTRADGEAIYVNFDRYIDPSTLVPSDFTISQSDDASQQIMAVNIKPGDLDNTISKSIQLVVANTILDSTATITISYKKGALTGLYGGAVQSFNPIAVKNIASGKFTLVTLQFDDLCGKYKNVYVKGSIKSLAFKLYDDKTNGDITANDNKWSKTLQLAKGSYNWAVYQRTITAYDTIRTINEITGAENIVITPRANAVSDSLLTTVMSVTVSYSVDKNNNTIWSVKGDTIAYVCNKSVTFMLDMSEYAKQNPSKSINPFLMGVNNDWNKGIEMDKTVDNLTNNIAYSTTLNMLNAGDSINFNFKNGDDWENISPKTRRYTIIGNDTIRTSFILVSTSTPLIKKSVISIYPNPVYNQLFISNIDNQLFDINIYNLLGINIMQSKNIQSYIDVSKLVKGVYIIELHDKNGNSNRFQFIKK